MDLKEWISVHVKNRDLLHNLIISLEEEEGYDLVARRSDGDRFYLVCPELSDADSILHKGADRWLGVVTLNTQKNVDFLVKNWDSFKGMERLCFYFVNPDAGEKWMLFPKTHDLITEKPALKPGLLSLYSSIAPYD